MSKESSFPIQGLCNRFTVRKGIKPGVLFGFIFLLGAALRIYDLGAESYWVDEIYTLYEGQQNISQFFTLGRLDQPPAYYVPFHFWLQILGTSEVSTRMFSAMAGLGSLILIYIIGRELFGKAIGLLGAFLMAISEFQVIYSQETRFYTFFEFTTLLSFLFFILALKNKSIIHYVLYCLATILMLYSHTYGVFALAAQNLFFILQGKKYRHMIVRWLVCQASILTAFLPYFFPMVFGAGGVTGAASLNSAGTTIPSLIDPLRFTYRFILPARGERSWTSIFASYAAAGALLIVGTWIHTMRHGKSEFMTAMKGWAASLLDGQDIKSGLLLVGCWFLSPIMLPFIFSFVVTPMYKDRYTICAAPAFYLLLALGIFSIRNVVPVIVSLGALAVIIMPSLQLYYATDIHQQWKDVAAYVEEYSASDDIIVFAGGIGTGIEQKSFDWYYQDALPICNLSNDLVGPAMKSDALIMCTSKRDRFWVLIRNSTEPSNSTDTYKSFFISPAQTTGHLIKSAQFIDISVYLFESTK